MASRKRRSSNSSSMLRPTRVLQERSTATRLQETCSPRTPSSSYVPDRVGPGRDRTLLQLPAPTRTTFADARGTILAMPGRSLMAEAALALASYQMSAGVVGVATEG